MNSDRTASPSCAGPAEAPAAAAACVVPTTGAPPARAAAPRRPDPSWRLIAVLAGGGAVAGLLLVIAYLQTQPAIREHKARVLEAGVVEVLGQPARFETLVWRGGRLVAGDAAGGSAGDDVERVWLGRRADGSRAGYAIVAAEPGFADDIRLIFGWEPATGRVLALKVLANKETPGLGDVIEKDPRFAARFVGAKTPLKAVRGGSKGPEAGEVDAITGATISSRAVVRIVNHAVEAWRPRIEAYEQEAPR